MVSRSQVSANLGKLVAILRLALGLGLALWLALTSARYIYNMHHQSCCYLWSLFGPKTTFSKSRFTIFRSKAIREEVAHHPFKCYQGIYKQPYDPNEALAKQGFSKVYDCGSVSGFVKWVSAKYERTVY